MKRRPRVIDVLVPSLCALALVGIVAAIGLTCSTAMAGASASGPDVLAHPDALFGHIVKRSYLHSGLWFGGEVVDGFGQPAGGVSIVVLAGNLDGSGMTAEASTVTGRHGRFGVPAPRGGPRLLVVTAGGTSLEEIRELVGPSVWVRVSSLAGARLEFRGRIFAPGVNPPVMLQSRTPRGWQTFAGLMANSGNHGFAYVYHASPATVGYRYAFRAVTLPTVPWTSGASQSHLATVRP